MSELKQIQVGSDTYDIRDAGALREDQGTENAGKVMTVGTDGKTAPMAPGGGTERKTGTLTTAGWTAGTGYAYEQTLTLDGVTAETDFDYDCELSGTDVEADATVLEAFSLVVWAGSQAGGIKFCATDKPDSNIPMLLRVYQ